MANNYTAQDSHESSSLIAALQRLKCDSIHYIGQGVCPRCLSTVHDALAAALAVVRAEGRKQGLEEAAMRCEELVTGGTYAVEQAADEQCNECAREIRALKERK